MSEHGVPSVDVTGKADAAESVDECSTDSSIYTYQDDKTNDTPTAPVIKNKKTKKKKKKKHVNWELSEKI